MHCERCGKKISQYNHIKTQVGKRAIMEYKKMEKVQKKK